MNDKGEFLSKSGGAAPVNTFSKSGGAAPVNTFFSKSGGAAPVNTETTSPDVNAATPAVNTGVFGLVVMLDRLFSGSEKWPVSPEFG